MKRILLIGLVALLLMTTLVSAKTEDDYSSMSLDELEAEKIKVYEKTMDFYEKGNHEKQMYRLDYQWYLIDKWIRIKTPPTCNRLGCGGLPGGSWE